MHTTPTGFPAGRVLPGNRQHRGSGTGGKQYPSFAPYDDRFLYLLSRIAFQKNQYNEAIRTIAAAVAINPYRVDYFAMWSQILLSRKEYEAALHKAEEGLAINPEDEACLNLRSHALFRLGKERRSLFQFARSTGTQPGKCLHPRQPRLEMAGSRRSPQIARTFSASP